jgi:hypothetical protein
MSTTEAFKWHFKAILLRQVPLSENEVHNKSSMSAAAEKNYYGARLSKIKKAERVFDEFPVCGACGK